MDLTLDIGELNLPLSVSEMNLTLDISEMNIVLLVVNTDCIGGYVPSVGETFRITATIVDLDGNPVTAGTHTIDLYEPDNSLNQTSIAPTHDGGGVWHRDFTTLATDPVGGYLVVWTVVSGGATGIGKIKVFIDDPPI